MKNDQRLAERSTLTMKMTETTETPHNHKLKVTEIETVVEKFGAVVINVNAAGPTKIGTNPAPNAGLTVLKVDGHSSANKGDEIICSIIATMAILFITGMIYFD